MKLDHSSALEALAAEYNRNPLHVLEWFLERAAIREYEAGMSRADAERAAVEDVRAELSGAPHRSQQPTLSPGAQP